MILVAFTNYDSKHQPPGNLFTWVGLTNFRTMLGIGSTISNTFWPVLGWTLIWAVIATFSTYIGGILLAILINKKNVKIRGFWRTMFILSIAIPQFVTLLTMRSMLQDEGAVNVLLQQIGVISGPIHFWTDATLARITVIGVNLWIGIPYTMLTVTGILMNIPKELYEAAKVDGANPIVIFLKITMPYILFITAPTLITGFIGNINNFNVIYLLTAGGPASLDYFQAGKTDLLVTWLYKLTVTGKEYSYASTIGIIVFILSVIFSLLMYRRTAAYKEEGDFS
jgi:arabinogalactan oligomer/maltooligosaccharide transport system permease protein